MCKAQKYVQAQKQIASIDCTLETSYHEVNPTKSIYVCFVSL